MTIEFKHLPVTEASLQSWWGGKRSSAGWNGPPGPGSGWGGPWRCPQRGSLRKIPGTRSARGDCQNDRILRARLVWWCYLLISMEALQDGHEFKRPVIRGHTEAADWRWKVDRFVIVDIAKRKCQNQISWEVGRMLQLPISQIEASWKERQVDSSFNLFYRKSKERFKTKISLTKYQVLAFNHLT